MNKEADASNWSKDHLTLSLIAFPIILTACLDDEVTVEPRVYFVSPASGDTVSTELVVRLGAVGFAIVPAGVVEDGSGYLNLFIDVPCAEQGEIIAPSSWVVPLVGGETEVALELNPGRYTLCVRASNGAGLALPLTASVEIDVVETGIEIVSPAEGSATGTHVIVEMVASGLVIEPSSAGVRANHGHFYLAIDSDCPREDEPLDSKIVNLDKGQLTASIDVPVGPHTICAGVADGHDHALEYRAYTHFWAY